MDLLCFETAENEESMACVDETLLQDRVLKNMIKTEDRYVSMYSSSVKIQREITEQMILIVGTWMMEVRFCKIK